MFIRATQHVGNPLLGFFLTALVFGATAYALDRTGIVNPALHWGAQILIQIDPTRAETGHWY